MSNSTVRGVSPIVGRGVLVFLAGAAIAGLSLVVQQAFIRAVQHRG